MIRQHVKRDEKMDSKEFIKEIKGTLRLLREKRKAPPAEEWEIWLADNHYLLESEGKRVIAELKKGRLYKGKNEAVISLADEYVKTLGEIDEKGLDGYLSSCSYTKALTSREFDSLLICIVGKLVCLAGEAARSERGDLMATAVKNIRRSDSVSIAEIAKSRCALCALLEKDGDYRKMDELSKSVFLERIAEKAEKAGENEYVYAKKRLASAKDGETVFDVFPHRPEKRVALCRTLTLIFAPLLLCAVFFKLTGSLFLSLLLYLPVFSILLVFADTVSLQAVTPKPLLRTDVKKGLPENAETAVVISCLFHSVKSVTESFERLERHFLSNPDGRLILGLLCDLPDGKEESLPVDTAVKRAAAREFARLERLYKDRFFIYLRPREYSKTQECFTGRERKRGAIADLLEFMRGKKKEGVFFKGNREKLLACRFLLTLDSDTDLQSDTVKELVSIAIHPENIPVTADGRVKKGYGILAPRITTSLSSSRRTSFSQIMSGTGGASSYSGASKDIYQDLYGSGLFSGKGLIHVDAALAILPHSLPENKILSHDIPEGCLLKAAFVSDVELTDGCPAFVSGWFNRLHRWTRGDTQNICLLFSKRLDTLSKYKLIDNIRRALTFPAIVLCFLLVPFSELRTAVMLAVTAFLAIAPGEYLTLLFRSVRRLFSKGRFAGVSPALEAARRAFALTVVCAETAAVSADGFVRGLYRLLVSKRRLMEWTTAAEGDKGKLSCKRGSFIGLVLLLITLFYPHANLISLPVAVLWLVSPVAAREWDKGRLEEKDTLSQENKGRLENYASSMWRFFEDTLKEEYGFLPPDNIQLSPVKETALRTSPTNIGLALLSTLAARDLDFISTAEMTDILEKTLSTCVKLNKYHGNLYNWYSLEDLSVLSPSYVSSVDSGNFLCSLITLREGINEYRREDSRLFPLIPVIDKLIEETDLSVFVDGKRNRFVTGIDEKGEKSTSAYDLLMSEALLTVYCGVALNRIPKKVFSSLGRLCGRIGNKTGALSWTGTAFEYFMPTLFLPVFKGSFIASSLAFAYSAQKDRVKKERVPFGISESGFYGFDPLLHYKYRAHGVQKAALCRGQDADLVISPYSSFLLLAADKEGAMKNLNRLKNMGMYGEYGFFEALDLTVSRTKGGQSIVESFMSHHIGMSMIASANALQSDRFVKRFMSYPAINAARGLLCERIPYSAPVYKGFDDKREKKPPRAVLPEREYESLSPFSPKVHLMSGKGLTAVMTDTGCMYLKRGDTLVTAKGSDLISDPEGIFCILSSEGKRVSLTAAPDFSKNNGDFCRQVKFSSGETVYFAHFDTVDASLSFTLSGEAQTGSIQLVLKNLSGKKKNVDALLFFEPVLAREDGVSAHRAFEKLFLTARQTDDGIVFSRREGRGTGKVSLAVSLPEEGGFEMCLNRSDLLKRPLGTASLTENIDFIPTEINGEYFCPDLCFGGKTGISLAPYSQKSITLFFALDREREKAVKLAREARIKGRKGMKTSLSRESCNRAEIAGIDEMCRVLEGEILPRLIFFHPYTEEKREAVEKITANGDGILWRESVSGDLPIILVEVTAASDLKKASTFLRIHRHLSLCDIKSDLVFLLREGNGYFRPLLNGILSEMRSLGLDFEQGKKGGVFTVDVTDRKETEDFFIARAAYFAKSDKPFPLSEPLPFVKKPVFPVQPLPFDEKEGFTVDPTKHSPKRPWCHILANDAFGTLLSDKTLGHTYALSSRENRLTPWLNDVSRDLSGEGIVIDVENKRYDPIRNSAVRFTNKKAEYRGKTADMKTDISVTLAERLPVKKITVRTEGNKEKNFSLSCYFEASPDSRGRKPVLRVFEKYGALITENLSGALFSGYTFLYCENGVYNCDREAFLSGKKEGSLKNYGDGFCECRVKGEGEMQAVFYLGYSKTLSGVKEILSALKKPLLPVRRKQKIEIRSGDSLCDRLVNEFLPHQISVCRIKARTAFYQSSGARGFRDQLQDACNEVIYDPVSARIQILRAACRQFEKGDVLHWWQDRGALPPVGSRTKCSDDLLWLPYSVCRYISVTGDESILDVVTPYIEAEELKNENEKFVSCVYSDKKDTVYAHCLRALFHADRKGSHGLMLIGSCDWNDGLSKVGERGKGESVWASMFYSLVCKEFAGICKKRDDRKNEKELLKRGEEHNEEWLNSFDGDRFIRAYDDEGRPLGKKGNREMEIDILTQSFPSFLFPEDERSVTAVQTAMELLVDEEKGIIKLFTPPFCIEKGETDAGYIASYPKGIRENGGQYTHGAIWFLFALVYQNRIEDAWRLAKMISPFESFKRNKNYGGEPFYMAADVSANKSNAGEAGWTVYTGAAGWYYRLLIEELYGIKRRGDRLFITPKLQKDMSGYTAELELGSCKVHLTVKRTGRERITVNGAEISFKGIPLKEGETEVFCEII